MFFCEDCRIRNSWPDSIGKSLGRCEICDTRNVICNDIPSSALINKIGKEQLRKLADEAIRDLWGE